MTNAPEDRFMLARKAANMSLLRLRAEVLLKHGDAGTIRITSQEREVLERIAVTSHEKDREFLSGFDKRLVAWRRKKRNPAL